MCHGRERRGYPTCFFETIITSQAIIKIDMTIKTGNGKVVYN